MAAPQRFETRSCTARLEALRRRALRAVDEVDRKAAIDQANRFLQQLEETGAITAAERLMFGRDWVRAFARDHIRNLGDEGAAEADRWRFFLIEH
jgi:hypothetical protein